MLKWVGISSKRLSLISAIQVVYICRRGGGYKMLLFPSSWWGDIEKQKLTLEMRRDVKRQEIVYKCDI